MSDNDDGIPMPSSPGLGTAVGTAVSTSHYHRQAQRSTKKKKASSAAAAVMRGRKTGVQMTIPDPTSEGAIPTSPETGMEDVDQFWKSTGIDEDNNNDGGDGEEEEKLTKSQQRERSKLERKAKREAALADKRARAAAKARAAKSQKPNFRLVAPTPDGDAESENSDPQHSGGGGRSKAKVGGRWAEKMARNTAAGTASSSTAFSPSDLSRVSTAPPTPFVASEDVAAAEAAAEAAKNVLDSLDGSSPAANAPAGADEAEAVVEGPFFSPESGKDEDGKEEHKEEEEDPATPEQSRVATAMDAASAASKMTSDSAGGGILDGILRQRNSGTPESGKVGVVAYNDDVDDDMFPGNNDDDDLRDEDLDGDGLGGGEDDDGLMVSPPPPSTEKSMDELLANTNGGEGEEGEEEEEDGAGQYHNDDDDDDDDKESGVGFQMMMADDDDDDDDVDHQPVTPTQTRDEQEEEEEEEVGKSKKKSKSKKKAKKSTRNKDDDDVDADTSMEVTPEDGKKKKKKKKATKKRGKKKVTYESITNFSTPEGKSHGYPAGNRDYRPVPVTDYKGGDDDEDNGRRRSRRARFPPLAYWKNERVIYEAQNEEGMLGEVMGDMPVVSGVLTALPTPYKERKGPVGGGRGGGGKRKRKGGKKKKGGDDDDDDDRAYEEPTPFDTKKLRKKYDINDGENALTWDEAAEEAADTRIISYSDGRQLSGLPLTAQRSKRESKVVARAAQSFHIPANGQFPGWISGQLELPPTGIKDAEGVGLCSQVFNVARCQPKAVEFAIADPEENDGQFSADTAQRFLVSPGDMFYVPAGNVYRIENHSKTHDCQLFWTIVRPFKNGSS